jgi:crotonobetainyl-CoA:carnitine CoA-transferase CaiB-like acyl-CoA transferase
MKEDFLPFEGCRILDLSEDGRMICGKILADLGADVIKIEPPGGSISRTTGPFFKNDPDPEKSLFWFALNLNKRGITLNIETSHGREIFKELVKMATVVVESFRPGYMESLGLGYDDLVLINPSIIFTSISDFGKDGPYRDWYGSDIVLMALSGYLYLCGDDDRPPVRISLPQAYLHAGAEGAAATAMAYYHLLMTGEGQYIDVSSLESLMWLSMQAQMYWDVLKKNPKRVGPCWITAATGNRSPLNWECKDGYITHLLMGGAEAKRAETLVKHMKEEGMAPDFLMDMDWVNFFDINVLTQENIDLVSGPIGEFFKRHTKAELLDLAIKKDLLLFPVSTIKDLIDDPQLLYREFWAQVEYDDLGISFKHPGQFAKFSEIKPKRPTRAPKIGEHNEEIYLKEMGMTPQELDNYRRMGVI